MASDWERGYAAGYAAAHRTDVRDITTDRGESAPRTRRTRSKTRTDSNMSRALTQINKKARLKNGDLRKGWTQSKVMKEAHKLRRKMR
tara:strand:- start:238 stop:501 length:264 start_codon:yes stop_codon:yes gene_type:complete